MYILFVPILNGSQKLYDLLYFYCLSYLKFSSESIYIDKKLSNYFYVYFIIKIFYYFIIKIINYFIFDQVFICFYYKLKLDSSRKINLVFL
jgi:hypothetical protein